MDLDNRTTPIKRNEFEQWVATDSWLCCYKLMVKTRRVLHWFLGENCLNPKEIEFPSRSWVKSSEHKEFNRWWCSKKPTSHLCCSYSFIINSVPWNSKRFIIKQMVNNFAKQHSKSIKLFICLPSWAKVINYISKVSECKNHKCIMNFENLFA